MKKHIKIFSVLLISLLFLSACTKAPSNKEVLKDAFKATESYESFEGSFDLLVEMDASEDEDIALFGNNMNLSGTFKSDVKRSIFEATVSTALMGMNMEMSVLINDDTMALRIPFLTGMMGLGDIYLLDHIDQMEGDKDADKLLKDFNQSLNKSIEDVVKEAQIEVLENQMLTTPKGDVKGELIQLKLKEDEINDFLKSVSQNLRESGLVEDDEVEEIEEVKYKGTVEIKFFVDEKGRLINLEYIMDAMSIDESTKIETPMTSTLKLMIWNINENVEITIPEFTDENSMSMDAFENYNPFEE